MLDGSANDTPPLESPGQYRRWAEVCPKEFLALRARADARIHTFLESYGAVNEAESFAVVTERFFDQPAPMKKNHSELYEVLRGFYHQDPAELDYLVSSLRND